ncbi:MAG: metal ABC transporter permease [Alphaproteobacteria bacterium]|nr:metal ABC transporter permease [Alphaproteobacteria bacterium]
MIELLIEPFTQYAFMKRALAACTALAIGGTPLGVFMTLRRMTLMGDAMSHAILPGVALAFALFGISVWHMTIGGLVAGVFVALLVVALGRFTQLKEDASLTMIYLLSLAVGVVIVSMKGSSSDLLHMLFGNILAIDDASLYLVSAASCASLLTLAIFYRGMVIECFDPDFSQASRPGKNWTGIIFFMLLVINLLAAFQALGTLMALGLIILPAIAARFWTRNIDIAIPLSIACALIASPAGLLISYYAQIPAGPAIVLTAGTLSLISALIGKQGSVLSYIRT